MKLRIENEIYAIDEQTLLDWMRLGRVPTEAYLLSETLTGGQWKQIHELDLDNEDPIDEHMKQLNSLESHFEKERKFLAYQRRRPLVTLTLISINTIIFLLLDQMVGRSQDVPTLIRFGAYSYPLIRAGEYWRLITNTFLHIGSFHLLLNMGVLLVIGYLIEGLYGRWRYLILYLVSAIGGSVISLFFVQVAIGAGASGAIFGLMGAFVALGLRYKDQIPQYRRRMFGTRLLPFIGLDIALGFIIPQINIAAHLGGLVFGFAAGLVLPPVFYTDRGQERRIVWGVAVGLTTLVIISGGMTLFAVSTDTAEAVPIVALPEQIEHYERLIRRRGYVPENYETLALLYIKAMRDQPAEAAIWVGKLKELYERALLEDPGRSTWNDHLLWLYRKTAFEKPDEPNEILEYIELCEKVVKRKGYHQPLYRNLEYFYTRAKTLTHQALWTDELENLYKKAIVSDPTHATWHNNLAWLYVEERRNLEKAVRLAQRAVKLDSTSNTVVDTLGWAYSRNGQHRRALRPFEQVLSTPVKVLFHAELKFQADLDAGHFSDDLRRALERQRFNPPKDATIEIDPENGRWLMTVTKDDSIMRLIILKGVDKLNFYAADSEINLQAKASSWDGLTALVQSEIDPSESQEFARAFRNFYRRLSIQFAEDLEAKGRLDAVFERFEAQIQK